MQPTEFNTFIDKLLTAFPSLHEWLNNPDKVRDPKATKLVWHRTLEPISYAEAIGVLDRWTTGALKAFSAFERDLVCTSIRAIVEADRSRVSRREVETKQKTEDANKLRKDYSPIAPILAKAVSLSRSGASQAAIVKVINDHFPAGAPYDGPRYKCYFCADRGKVEVWDNDVARAIDDGIVSIDSLEFGKTYNVACSCDAGTIFTKWEKKPLTRYQSEQFCRYLNRTIDEERNALAKWLTERIDAKKHQEFSSWAN